jgi:SAM-dependent methyltransferase
MAKQGEIDYLRNLGKEGIQHAINKPFSDPGCGGYLMEIGALMALLPPPPARLLDVGCGTGWTSLFFARRGYEVVGLDIAEDMIRYANGLKQHGGITNVRFVVGDYETFRPEGEFDCAVFYDALHHALDEEAALRMVHQALKPGGVCVTAEPGEGHAQAPHSLRAVAQFHVTERDMPPWKIRAAGKKVGFRRFQTFPHAYHLQEAAYPGKFRGKPVKKTNWLGRLKVWLSLTKLFLYRARGHGIVRMVK